MILPMEIGIGLSLARNAGGGLDPDAKAYIAAVEAADAQALESGVKAAYDTFIRGCKDDGIWDAIKASCILAGARTLSGALVPLKGTAPTNNNFVSGDYDRETGLLGDGSTKYLDSNRNNNADPQDDFSAGVYVYAGNTGGANKGYIGAGINSSGDFNIFTASSLANLSSRCRTVTSANSSSPPATNGLVGVSRSNSANYVFKNGATNDIIPNVSSLPFSQNIVIFGRNLSAQSDGKLSFYWIGESLDLDLIDARVSTLISDIAAAIP